MLTIPRDSDQSIRIPLYSRLSYKRVYSRFLSTLPIVSCPKQTATGTRTVNGTSIVTIREFYGSSQTVLEENHVSSNVTLVYSTK